MSTQDTTLANIYSTLDLPELTDHCLFDEKCLSTLKREVKKLREQFLAAWDESVEVERQLTEKGCFNKNSNSSVIATAERSV